MEHPDNGIGNAAGVVTPRLESLYPEFLSAVLDVIREDEERMKKYRADLIAACKAAKRKAVQLLEDWRSAPLEGGERAKITEAHELSEKAAETVFLSESLSLFNRALSAIEEARQMYLARREEEEKARRRAEEEAARIKAAEEERRRLAEEEAKRQEEERKRQQDARMAKIGLYLILGLMAAVVVQAIRMHWSASLLGLFASFLPPLLWRLTAPKNRPWAAVLGIVGFLAIPVPFIPLVLRHPYLAGIPVGVVMVVWLYICSILFKEMKSDDIVERGFRSGACWAILVGIMPQLAKWCDWSKLDGKDWSCLLQEQPQFADKCDWSKLDEFDWEQLLQSQPQFVSRRGK